jgi:hypothetical protein
MTDLWSGPLRRRELLRGGAGLALGLGLAGCGVGNQEPAPREQTERVVKAQRFCPVFCVRSG